MAVAHPAALAGSRRHSVNPPVPGKGPQANPNVYGVRRGKILTVSASNGVLANDSSPQAKALSAVLISGPAHGALFLNADGSFTYANDGTGASSDSFVYSATDGRESSSARVTIDVFPDRAPLASNDGYTVAAGATLTIPAPGVLANDGDPDADPLTAVLIAGPSHGTVTLAPNGSFTYIPDGTNAPSDSFTYASSDGTLESSAATVTITIDSSVRANSDTYPAAQNTPRTVDAPGVLANDFLNGAKVVSYGQSGGEQAMIGSGTPTTGGGTVALNADGSLRFNPAPYFAGADTFKYTLANPAGSSTAIVLMMVFAPPVANADSYQVSNGGPAVIAKPGVLGNDSAIGAAIVSYGPLLGSEQTTAGSKASTAAGGTIALQSDGSFTYTPPPAFTGNDTFKYMIGNFAGTSPATVTIAVAASPFAAPDTYQAAANTTRNVAANAGVLVNDSPNGAPIVSYGASSGGEQTVIGAATPTTAGNLVALSADGSFVYTPSPNFTGLDSFKYRLSNATGTSTAIVSISVAAVPLAANDSYPVSKNASLATAAPGVLANDVRNGGVIAGYGANSGSEQIILGGPAPTAQGGSVALSGDGSFNYSPPPNYIGTDSFRYALANFAGRSTATVTLSVSQSPSAANDSYVAVNSSAFVIGAPGVLANDTLNGAKLMSYGIGGGEQSALGNAAPTARGGSIALNGDGSFSYLPPATAAANETFNDTFRYVLTNSTGSSTATVTIQVALKCPPIAINPATLPPGAPGTPFGPIAFGQTGGAGAITWSVASGSLPAGVTLSSGGVLSGVPSGSGVFNVTIRAADANGCSGAVALSLAINCPSITITPSTTMGPGRLPAGISGVVYSPVTFSQSGGAAPVAWSVSAGSLPAGMAFSSAGVLSGTPSQTGTFSFTAKATDANGCTGTLALSMTVTPRCPAITIGPSAVPSGAAGVPYDAVSFSQTGGALPVTWSSGALPPGMSFSTAGVLSGTPTGKGVFNLTVTVTDANGCTATASLPFGIGITCPAMAIAPIALAAGTAGTPYPPVALSQTGGVGAINWSVLSGTLPAGMTFSIAGVLSGTPAQPVSATFTVLAMDSNGCFDTQPLTLDINSKCPGITVTAPATVPTAKAGVAYPGISFSQSGGVAPVAWSSGALPAGMSFSAAGVLAGTPSVRGTFNITVVATDANGCTGTLALTFTIDCPAITVIPEVVSGAAVLPAGVSGAAYSGVSFSATGGVAPIVWSVSSGKLPGGMTLSAAGFLSGTPAQTGVFDFTVAATDASSCSDTQAVTLTVSSQCSSITVSPPADFPSATAGIVYPAVGFSQSGGVGAIAWTSGTLPAGMSFSADGNLSGTPAAVGTFNIAVTATDSTGCTGTLVVTLTVACPTPLNIAAAALPSGVVGAPYSPFTFSVTNGIAPIAWSISAGTLPAGMTLSSAGVLSGTPLAAGTGFSFTVQASDKNGCTGTQAFTLAVAAAPSCPSITIPAPASLTDATAGVTYSANFTPSGGTGPYTFTSGPLPAGLSLSTAGNLFGTPTVIGTFNLSIQVVDANACPGSRLVTLTIKCPASITIISTTLPSGVIGTPYSPFTFSATNGVGPIAWSWTGSLPAGMNVSSAGVLSGTPLATGTGYSFTVKATDANGCTGTQAFTLAVNAAPSCPSISIPAPASLTDATAGVTYSANFTPSGGTGPYTFTSGPLPAGLSLSTAGNLFGTPTVIGTFNLSIQVVDANACPGSRLVTLTIKCPASITIISTTLPSGVMGAPYSPFTFSATNGVGPIAWSWTGSLPAGMNVSSAGVLSGTPLATGTGYSFTVKATDTNGCTGTQAFTLVVNAVPTCPITIPTPASLTDAIAGAPYDAVNFTAAGGTEPYTFSSGPLPAGMSLSTSGNLTGTPAVKGSFNLSIQVVDAKGCTGSRTVTLTIGCPTPITIISTTLPSGVIGAPYSPFTFSATNGVGPIAWSWTGSLPAGMNVSSAGVLSGTPLATGTGYIFTVKATDANGCSGTQAFTLVVNAAPSCPAISIALPGTPPPTSLTATAGDAFTAVNFTASGGTAPYTFTSGPLPAGMSFSTAGNLTGRPTVVGSFNLSIQVVDANGCTASRVVTLTITCPTPITITATTLPSGVINAPYSPFTFSATNGVGPMAWSWTGSLPAGINVSSAGVLSGTPLATGTGYNFTVQATDANGCTGTRAFVLVVNAAPSCPAITIPTPSSLTNATAGAPYTATFTPQGGTDPYIFTTGPLPPGLSLSTTGTLSGTPTVKGTYNLSIQVVDGKGCSGTRLVTLTIDCPNPISITPTTLSAGTLGKPYSPLTFSASAGVQPITWSVSAGTLPAGMTLSTAGVLSGTPLATGTGYSFTVKATDAAGCSGTQAVTLAVNAPCTFNVDTSTLTAGKTGKPYDAVSFTQSGGTAPVTWTSGALPPGMFFSTAGVLYGTPTVKGTFNISVEATDAKGCTATSVNTLTLTIDCNTVTVVPTDSSSRVTLPGGTVGAAYPPFTFLQIGGVAPITWSVTSGQLPVGISLSPGGVLSGTPTSAGMKDFTVQATDVNGCNDSQEVRLTMSACPTITITPTTLSNGTAGVNYPSVSFSASAGGNPISVTWSLSGTLPVGMTFVNGVLSGTPQSAGTSNFTVTATDANGCSGSSASLTLTITPPCPVITITGPAALPNGTAGVLYPSQSFTAPGGTTPYTWSLVPPISGLQISNGVLSGTPLVTRSGPVTVNVTDANGCTAAPFPATLTIGCQLVANNPVTKDAKVKVEYAQYCTQTNAVGGFTFTITDPRKPYWLSIDADGRLHGTPPDGSSDLFGGKDYTFTVSVTDGAGCTATTDVTLHVACNVLDC